MPELQVDTTPSIAHLLRDARSSLRVTHGQCCSTHRTLIRAAAERIINTAPWDDATRTRLGVELKALTSQ